MFYLAIGSRVSDGNTLDGDGSLIAKVPEVNSGESRTEVGDYAVREAEAVNYLVEQLGYFFGYALYQGFVLDPF
jgi:hypothetical protein